MGEKPNRLENLCHLFTPAPLHLFIFALHGSLSFCQIPDTIWARTVGGQNTDRGAQIIATSDSCLVIAGHTQSFGPGNHNFFLIKMGLDGDTLWTRVHGTPADDFCYHVLQTGDNGYLLTGSSGDSLCIIKTDMFGYIEWVRNYANGYDCIGYGACLASDNTYMITGHCQGSLGNVWLLKVDLFGDTLWTGSYGFASGDDWGHEVIEVSDGYLIVGGSFYTGADLYLLKTDFDGTQIWEKWYGGNMHDVGHSIVPTHNNNYYAVGMYWSVTTDADAWVLKINSSGDTLWSRTYGGYGIDYGMGIVPTPSDSGYIITGETALPSAPPDLYILKCSASGDSVWLRTYGGSLVDGSRSVVKLHDGGFASCGHTNSYGAGDYDVWVLRLNGEPGIVEDDKFSNRSVQRMPSIFAGSIALPSDKIYMIYDVTGRKISTLNPAPGIYFVESDGQIVSKITKVK